MNKNVGEAPIYSEILTANAKVICDRILENQS